MSKDVTDGPSTAAALEGWREAERRTVRLTAQREAADQALEAANLAAEAARATSRASDAAVTAASEAARAANATADAADKVLRATIVEGQARRTEESEAIEAEAKARAVYQQAVERHTPTP